MARIILGMATPHAPQLRLPLEGWTALRQKDETDRRIDYATLLRRAKPTIEEELTPERMDERYNACQASLRLLASRLAEATPDTIVVVGDDQHEQFLEQNMPMFSVYYGQTVEVVTRRSERAHSAARTWNAPRLDAIEQAVGEASRVGKVHPAEPALAGHLIDTLRDEDFDVACSNQLNPEVGLGHAFTFVYEHLLPSGDIPMVPLMINTFFPPNQPTPRRCYALGQALRRAIESWETNQTVAVVASGGLSHTIMDEEIDRMTIDAIAEKDADALKSLPRERLNLGTSEIRNWIAVAGAMEPLRVTFVGDYIPAYRSPAGTGCGMAFAYWD